MRWSTGVHTLSRIFCEPTRIHVHTHILSALAGAIDACVVWPWCPGNLTYNNPQTITMKIGRIIYCSNSNFMDPEKSFKRHSPTSILTPVFVCIKRLILVSIDMPKSYIEICQIFVELFVLKLSENQLPKNRLPAVDDSGESKIKPYTAHIFLLLKCSEQYSSWIVHFLLHCPFKGKGSPSMFLKITLRCQQWLPAINEAE